MRGYALVRDSLNDLPMLFTLISLLPTAGKRLASAKYVFFTGAAIKIAVSFDQFRCLCADLAVVRFCTFCFEGLLLVKHSLQPRFAIILTYSLSVDRSWSLKLKVSYNIIL